MSERTRSEKSDTASESAPKKGDACPTCGGDVDPNGGFAPFCSLRCRMADLNRWFSGEYVISRELKDTDLDELE